MNYVFVRYVRPKSTMELSCGTSHTVPANVSSPSVHGTPTSSSDAGETDLGLSSTSSAISTVPSNGIIMQWRSIINSNTFVVLYKFQRKVIYIFEKKNRYGIMFIAIFSLKFCLQIQFL